MQRSSCAAFCFWYVLVFDLVHLTEILSAAEAIIYSVMQVLCGTRLFLTRVEFFSFHFKQVRIQTVPASHLQQGTVSGSTKAVSTVVVTTAPSPKQSQDQLWVLVWKPMAFLNLLSSSKVTQPQWWRGTGLDSVTCSTCYLSCSQHVLSR